MEPIVWVRTGAGASKALVPLCSALCTAVVDDGVPDVGVQSHILENRTKSDGQPAFHRYTIKPDPTNSGWAFVPDQLAGNSNKVKHAELGALFFMNGLNIDKLPQRHAKVTWEMSLDTVPPPSLNALKPKFWLLKRVMLEAGKWYLLK